MISHRRMRKGLMLAAFIAALTAGAAMKWFPIEEGHVCCHLAAAQDPGQEPGQEEGNPSHIRPEKSCSHKPAKEQVDCHCKNDCNKDGTAKEDKRCRSFCYQDMCTCPRKPCA